jgi:TFIIF-interacting CTD phosphatase-like protein
MPLKKSENINKKTLYIDLDETLVNSSMTPIENADLVFPV